MVTLGLCVGLPFKDFLPLFAEGPLPSASETLCVLFVCQLLSLQLSPSVIHRFPSCAPAAENTDFITTSRFKTRGLKEEESAFPPPVSLRMFITSENSLK